MQQSISTSRKALYGAGDIMGTMAFTVTALFLPYYFTDVLGMPPFFVGLLIFIGNLWDASIDPFIGRISDRTKSRYGRRRPYFLVMAVPIGLTFVLLFSIPAGMALAPMFILAIVAYLAFLTTTSFYLVPYLAYGMEIERSYDGRTSITAWRMLFSIAFGLVGAVLPKMIWESAPTPSQGFLLMAILIAVPVGISSVFPFFAGREPEVKSTPAGSFLTDFRNAMKSSHFIKGLVIFVATWTGINVVQTLLIYYFKHVLCIPDQFEVVIGVLFGITILFLPVWVYVSKKLDKRKAYMLGAAVFIAGLFMLLFNTAFLIRYLWYIVPVLGIGLSALHVMPTALLPEAIDAASGGVSGEGAHYGIVTFLQKMCDALAQLGVMGILGIAGYIETTQEAVVQQPASAVTAIRLLLVVVPVLLLAAGILFANLFRIGREGRLPEKK